MIMIRRDSKGRRLFTGESQRADGKYEFKYLDNFGKRRTLYSWRLTEADPHPAGKKKDKPLRKKAKEALKKAEKGLPPDAEKTTVMELVERYISLKKGVRHNTKTGYNFVLGVLKKEDFAQRKIGEVKLSDAKKWLIKLQADGRGYSSIQTIRGVLRPAFQMAMDDDLLLKNPFSFPLASVVENDSVTRQAVSEEQERAFLDFVRNDKHYARYYEGIFILFKTGLRISEFCGLTISDIDFENHRIRVDHQLLRTSKMQFVIEETKTASGVRYIPMTEAVEECFRTIIQNRNNPKREPMINGKTGFLYLDKDGKPMVALHWQHYFKHIREKYNKSHAVQLPVITPHVCRHTFCSNMAKSGMNPKTLQYIMGHSDIGVTLNTYTHVRFEDARAEVIKLEKARVAAAV